MCHEKWFRRRRESDERFEEEVRFLFDREADRREPPTPVVEHDSESDPVAEPEPERTPAATT